MIQHQQAHKMIRVRFHIIRNACTENVGKSQSCMVSKLRITLCKGSRRVEFSRKASIGDWFGVLETLSLLAVITNALLTSFVNSTTAKIDPTIDVLQYPQQNQRWSVSRLW